MIKRIARESDSKFSPYLNEILSTTENNAQILEKHGKN